MKRKRERELGAKELAAHYGALADATRLRVIKALWQRREGTVTELCQELRISQPLMSWHLRILRRVGLVTTHREGRQVYCAVNPAVLGENGSLLEAFLGSSVDFTGEGVKDDAFPVAGKRAAAGG